VSGPRLALLGVGYIGGSAALAAKRAGVVGEVVGYDVDPGAGPRAIQQGVVDRMAIDPPTAVDGATFVLLAAPVRCLDGLVNAIAPALAPDALVMDVGSVKREFVEATSRALPLGQVVGCHPMAGAEFAGVASADPGIFPGRLCYLCPPPGTPEPATRRASSFWERLGCRTQVMDPAIHDRLMALQSHLPHVAAFALAASLAGELSFIEVQAPSTTTSLRDTSRIAASSPAVWRDILLANAQEMLPLIRRLGATLETMGAAIAARDSGALEALLSEGQQARRRLVKE
jgi:prephenate dehydrogenase